MLAQGHTLAVRVETCTARCTLSAQFRRSHGVWNKGKHTERNLSLRVAQRPPNPLCAH